MQAEKVFMLLWCVGVTWAAKVRGERMNNLVLTFYGENFTVQKKKTKQPCCSVSVFLGRIGGVF